MESILKTHRKKNPDGGSVLFTVGGDHVLSFGTYWASSNLSDDVHFIWIDAHTHVSSHSGNCHGMPMSYSFGLVESKKIGGPKSYMAHLGLRSIDAEEEQFLQILERDGLKRYSADEIKASKIESGADQRSFQIGEGATWTSWRSIPACQSWTESSQDLQNGSGDTGHLLSVIHLVDLGAIES